VTVDLHMRYLRCHICPSVIPLLLETMGVIIPILLPEKRTEPGVRLKPNRLPPKAKSVSTQMQESYHLQTWWFVPRLVFPQSRYILHSHKNPNNPLAPKSTQVNIKGGSNESTHSP
jgi:hypothetical protein